MNDITEQQAVEILREQFPSTTIGVSRFRTVTLGQYHADSLSFLVTIRKKPAPCELCGSIPSEKYFHGDTLRKCVSDCLGHYGKSVKIMPETEPVA